MLIARVVPGAAERLLADSRVGWSIGRQGAIAEFYWDPAEAIVSGDHSLATDRGSLRLDATADLKLFAGESIGHSRDSLSQCIAFAIPCELARTASRTTITEIGGDTAASHDPARHGILFDLGIGGRYYEICVRASARPVLDALRSACGKQLFDAPNVIHALVDASPPRVFRSRFACIEVHQTIAAPDGHSPEGPHTHVLPDLLRSRPDDAGNAPPGWCDQLVAYPPNPLRDAAGQPKRFDIDQYLDFQSWLAAHGDAAHVATKETVMHAVRAGKDPDSMRAAIDSARAEAVRIALRQLRCLDGESSALARWIAAYDR